MGRWSTYLMTPAEHPIPLEDPAVAPHLAAGSCDEPFDHGGMWVIELRRDETELDALLGPLYERHQHPVLAAEVMDSDGAHVVGLSRAGRWATWLHLDRVISHVGGPLPPCEFVEGLLSDVIVYWDDPDYLAEYARVEAQLLAASPEADQAAPLAVRWAADAGRPGVDEAAVRAAMEETTVFVEEQLFHLVGALGFVPAETPG